MPTFKITGPNLNQTCTVTGNFADATEKAAALLGVSATLLKEWHDDAGDLVLAVSDDDENVTVHECTQFLSESEKWMGKASKAESTFDSVEQFLSYCQAVWGQQPDLYENLPGEWRDRSDGHALVLVAV